jgi:hypothetical protein
MTARERARADFNRDNLYDVLWSNRSSGQLVAWSVDESTVKLETGLSHSMTDVNWEVAGTGDFNGDGKPDIVWRHKLYGFIGVWFMDGLTNVGVVSFSIPQVDPSWRIVGVGDLNNDGHADLVWQHNTGLVSYWQMNRTTAVWGALITGEPSMTSDVRWKVKGVADMNGDNQMDLLWRHDDGRVGVWLMSSASVYGVQLLNPASEPDLTWNIVGTVDANKDGKQDILWQRSTDGKVAVWYMDGLNRLQVQDLAGGSLTGTVWKVVGPK